MLETLLASVLASLLGILLGMSCATFGRPAIDVDARARITQEAILAAQSLACDLGGFLADSSGRTGTSAQYQLLPFPHGWDLSQSNVLKLNYQGATAAPTDLIVITYQQSGNQLVRYDSSTGVTTTIATYLIVPTRQNPNPPPGFSVEPNPDNASQAQIKITISYRNFTGTYTLIGVSPT